MESKDLRGYDPYDALNSPILRALAFRRKSLRILFIQLLKRLPINPRPFLFIKKGYNPKGLGLFLWGYAKLYAIEKDARYLEQIDKLLGLLKGLKSRDCEGNGWGYNFDWQSRVFFVPKYTPTVVNSAFIGHALLDTYASAGLTRAREMALPIGDFILSSLHRMEENGTICFSYTPIDYYFVHNSNLLAASILIRLYRETGNGNLKKAALAALAYSMKHQQANGSWFYAERDLSHWIDSFHTGFNLQAIRYFLNSGFAEEYRQQFEKGVHFYAENFFLADGTPKYYHNRVYPIDIHSPTQALVFFSQMGPKYAELTRNILKWMTTNMQAPEGFFYFQKHRHYTNNIPYMRWCQAWAFHALSEYLYSSESGSFC
ncbi:MAG: delta-aminolevulinic acid dehydratase [Syntrophorhabdus sp.]